MADPITREQVERAMDVPQPDPLAYADSPVWDDGPMLARPVPEAVPQPEPWHARLVRLAQEAQSAGQACAEAEAAFTQADADREKARLARAAAREMCHAKRQALTAATTAAAIVEAAQQSAPVAEPTRPEPRYKVGDWVRGEVGGLWRVADVRRRDVGDDCYDFDEMQWRPAEYLTPALDPALHETARTAARMLHKGEWPLKVERARELPGFTAWDTGELRTPDWAAQLERLLGDAS
ncbi:MAG: hypothetical protein IPK85_01375 [Gemmatimonadetes bacterium]|nr:hypothetical protein [Gemmatimonadota bacterium]